MDGLFEIIPSELSLRRLEDRRRLGLSPSLVLPTLSVIVLDDDRLRELLLLLPLRPPSRNGDSLPDRSLELELLRRRLGDSVPFR